MFLEIQTPEPHSKSQEQIMRAFITPGVKEIVVACGTKYGKSLSGASALIVAAPLRRQKLFRWVSPIYSQARIGFKYLKRMLPGPPYTKLNEANLIVNFPHIDTQVQCFHGQTPESLEGEACDGYILDEAAKLKPLVYAACRTTTTVTKGPIVYLSTPLGKNHFYHKAMDAKARMEWAYKHNRTPESIFITAPTSDNKYVPQESIDFAKKTLIDRLFRQYYFAEFLDEGSIFTNINACIEGEDINPDEADCFMWVHEDSLTSDVVIGVDWAKTLDFAVTVAICLKTGRVIGIRRQRNVAYKLQIMRLKTFLKCFKNVCFLMHDKTGVGVALDELLEDIGCDYYGVTFNNSNKAEMVALLMNAFEAKEVIIPNYQTMLEELSSFEVRSNNLGMMFYSAPKGEHDDLVTGLMLAWYACLKIRNNSFDVKVLENLDPLFTEDLAYDD